MRDLVITPFGDDHLVLFPGRPGAVRLPPGHYAQLAQSPGSSPCPDWLASIVQAHWQHDVHGLSLADIATIPVVSQCAPRDVIADTVA